MSERTDHNISTLIPEVQPVAKEFMEALQEQLPDGFSAEIISALRTYDEQDDLYEQGRSKPGHRVTNARGGYSNHNFGVAWDVGIFEGKRYLEDSHLYDLVGKVAHSMDLVWGGDWKSIEDKPHVEWRPDWGKDLSESEFLAQCRNLHNHGESLA